MHTSPATYAITALRWEHSDIVEAMVGLIDDPRAPRWDVPPAPARVADVVDRLVEGDIVVAMFPGAAGEWQVGPEIKVDVLPDGAETLALDDGAGRRLDELPRF